MTSCQREQTVLEALTPVAARLLERHLGSAREWFPHELVPWSRGRDFESGWTWTADEAPELDLAVRSALYVNLLTEDNLPFYFRDIERMFGADGPWGEWVRRWTAEEGRHSIVIRDYLTVSRMIDPVELERGRMNQVSGGVVPSPESAVDALVYVALQELATRVAHMNTAKAMTDRAGYEVLKRVAADENLHHLYYRDLVAAAIEVDPSLVAEAVERQVKNFEMPGTGIPGFQTHARAIATCGIYDLAVHHDQILEPVLIRNWAIDQMTGLDGPGEKAREGALHHMQRLGRLAKRRASRQVEKAQAAANGSG